MTDITYQTATAGIASPSALLSRIAVWCTHFVEGVREGQEIAARYHALARLSTPELARHGFNRQTIARAALTGY
ncbi:MAG TPA: DUF1127 domain-containing protein [Pseudolabrys sp.]|jgi:hypothetical protein|nr:DUF1127 domain-containing protein [Pseudolabrys sp.]